MELLCWFVEVLLSFLSHGAVTYVIHVRVGSQEEIAEAIELQRRIRQATTIIKGKLVKVLRYK